MYRYEDDIGFVYYDRSVKINIITSNRGHKAVMCCRGGGSQTEACWRYNCSHGDAGPRAFCVQSLRKCLQAPGFTEPAPRSAS